MKTRVSSRKAPTRAASPRSTRGSKAAGPAAGAVRIEVHLGGAREVYLAGTFNDWHETTLPMVDLGHGRWMKELVLEPGVYEYLLIADGRWVPDPAAEAVANPFGGSNSLLRVG